MSGIIEQLARQGTFSHDEVIGDVTFTLGILGHEEQMLADGLVNMEELYNDIAGDEEKMMVYQDAVNNYKMVSRLAIIIRSINGVTPIKNDGTVEERIISIKEFRDDLMKFDPAITSRLNNAYNELVEKRFEFFKKSEDIAKK